MSMRATVVEGEEGPRDGLVARVGWIVFEVCHFANIVSHLAVFLCPCYAAH